MIELSQTKALGIFAHPDDAELLCYGTMRRLVAAGSEVKLVVGTRGEKGVFVSDQAGPELSEIRREETTQALSQITNDIRYLGFPDGELRCHGPLIRAIESIVNEWRPDFVLTHFSDTQGVDHQDHLAVGTAVRNIVFRKPFVRFLLTTQPLKSHTAFRPNFFVEISPYFHEKCDAIKEHQSQTGRYYLTQEFHSSRHTAWPELLGVDKCPEGHYFESFQLEKGVILQ